MRLQLRFGFALVVGALIAAGCTVGDPGQDAGPGADTGLIPNIDAGHDSGASPPTCEPGEIDCGGTCARVAEDSLNCGSCGNVCPTGFSCAIGRCDCAEPMKSCNGLCTDPSSDTRNCGSCGNVCAAGDTCIRGECITHCEDPLVRCQNTAADGSDVYVCANLQSDAMNCGRCDTRCAGGAICQGGYCGCATGQVSCSGMCTDLATDANNCGGCLNSCGADGVCSGGRCTSCGSGLSACGSPRRCVDTYTSRLHCGACGNACGAGESCNGGRCQCLPGLVECDDVCRNLDTDVHNCGGCGIDCGPGGACTAGVCSCAAGLMMCGPSCADITRDRAHCGSCDAPCGTNETCRASTCVPIGSFRVTSWGATGCTTLEHNSITGDDRGGIAVSDTTLFVTGDSATGRVSASDLSGLATVTGGVVHNGLISDLESGTVYVLLTAAGTEPNDAATITQLGVLDGSTGALTATRIPLSQNIAVTYGSGVFSGYQEALIARSASSRLEWWQIDLPSGTVTQLGTTQSPTHRTCENWAWWGVAERFSGVRYASYVASSTAIARIAIPDSGTDVSAPITTVATFTNLGDMCSITFSPALNRWYFHHEYDSQFAPSGSEVLGSCDGTYDLP